MIKGDDSIDYAEERRLFYVAMTRTKNRVFFIAPEQNPSEFLLELKRDYKNVVLRGEWNDDPERIPSYKKACPVCGYPMQYRYKNAYGLRLYICTNEPEVCGFMTNEYKAGKLAIIKCDQCRDGYLIVKPGQNKDFILGCTNYKKDGTGCNRLMTREFYMNYMGLKEDLKKPLNVTPNKAYVPKPESEKRAPVYTHKEPQNKEDATNPDIVNTPEKASVQGILYRNRDLNGVLQVALSALNNISKKHYYGITTLIDVLRGSENKKIIQAGLNNVPEYGALRTMSRDDVSSIIEWLIAGKYILQTKGMYPVLHPTYKGLHYNEMITKGQLLKLLDTLNRES